MTAPTPTEAVLREILHEIIVRGRRDGLSALMDMPDGTGPEYAGVAEQLRTASSYALAHGSATWRHLLSEDVYSALSQTEPKFLRAELVRLGAVVTAWVVSLDRRSVSH